MRALVLLVLVCWPLSLRQLERPTARFSTNLVLVLDRSGSMNEQNRLPQALAACRTITAQPTDELRLKLVVFGSRVQASTWVSLPDPAALRNLQEWARTARVGTATYLKPALAEALLQKEASLSVVVVSDGEFYEPKQTVLLPHLLALQASRVKMGLGQATVAFVGVGPGEHDLRLLGRAGRGGTYRWEQDE